MSTPIRITFHFGLTGRRWGGEGPVVLLVHGRDDEPRGLAQLIGAAGHRARRPDRSGRVRDRARRRVGRGDRRGGRRAADARERGRPRARRRGDRTGPDPGFRRGTRRAAGPRCRVRQRNPRPAGRAPDTAARGVASLRARAARPAHRSRRSAARRGRRSRNSRPTAAPPAAGGDCRSGNTRGRSPRSSRRRNLSRGPCRSR
jgi:hypothetical protein